MRSSWELIPQSLHVKQQEVLQLTLSLLKSHPALTLLPRIWWKFSVMTWHGATQQQWWWGNRKTMEALFRGSQTSRKSEGGILLVTTHPGEKERLWVHALHRESLSVCVELLWSPTDSPVKLNILPWMMARVPQSSTFFSGDTEFT